MRKILATVAVTFALTGAAHAQYFWGSGPGGGMGGGWNNCANCGMRGFGGGGGIYSGWAGATNGFGAGQRGWLGIPSANGYGTGTNFGGLGAGMLGGMLPMPGMGMFGGGGPGMGGMGMLGGLFGGMGGMFGGLLNGGNYYPGAIYQRPGVPQGNYAYGATRSGGGGAIPQYQYRQGGYQGNPGPGYGGGYYGGGPNYRREAYAPQVQYIQEPRQRICKLINTGYSYTRVCY